MAEGLIGPTSGARVLLKESTGKTLFGGYICGQPTFNSLGYGINGLCNSIHMTAFSDESLLDAFPFEYTTSILSTPAQQAWKAIAMQSSNPQLQLIVSDKIPSFGQFSMQIGAKWSEAAGVLACNVRSSYRFVDKQLEVIPIAQTVHRIDLGDPALKLQPAGELDLRYLASDVILTGKIEPQAYMSEIFEGDGTTSSFQLSRSPFCLDKKDNVR